MQQEAIIKVKKRDRKKKEAEEKAREDACIAQINPATGSNYTSCANKKEAEEKAIEDACKALQNPEYPDLSPDKYYTSCEHKAKVTAREKQRKKEDACRKEINPDTGRKYESCAEKENAEKERACKREINPDTGRNYKSCTEKREVENKTDLTWLWVVLGTLFGGGFLYYIVPIILDKIYGQKKPPAVQALPAEQALPAGLYPPAGSYEQPILAEQSGIL